MEQPTVTATFNLWSVPWITLERIDGGTEEVSLEQALLRAAEFTAIFDTSPLVVVGIHRLLTAIVQFMIDPQYEDEIADLWRVGGFPIEKIKEFGQQYSHRFDLFSAEEPFMQSADIALHVPKRSKSANQYITELIPELPAGDFVTHYRHGHQAEHPVCPACAAKNLLLMPAFATPGGRGYSTGVNGIPPVYIMPVGTNLFASLVASLIVPDYQPPIRYKGKDEVWWVRPSNSVAATKLQQVGYLQSLLLPTRRIRLHLPVTQAMCVRCNQFTAMAVTQVTYGAGESKQETNELWLDPFVAYKKTSAKGSGKPSAVRVNPGKAIWREFSTLFLNDPGRNTPPPSLVKQLAELFNHGLDIDITSFPFRCIGMRSDQAKIFEWIDASFNIPLPVLLNPEMGMIIRHSLAFSEVCADIIAAVFKSSYGIRSRADGSKSKQERFKRVKQGMIQEYWTLLAEPFQVMVSELATTVDSGLTANKWLDTVVGNGMIAFKNASHDLGDDGKTLRLRVQAEVNCKRRLVRAKAKQTGG